MHRSLRVLFVLVVAAASGCHLGALVAARCDADDACDAGAFCDDGYCVVVVDDEGEGDGGDGEGEGEECVAVAATDISDITDAVAQQVGLVADVRAIRVAMKTAGLGESNAAVQVVLADGAGKALRLKLLRGHVEWNDSVGAGSRSIVAAETDGPIDVELHTDGTARIGDVDVVVGAALSAATSVTFSATCEGASCGAASAVHLESFGACRLGDPAPVVDDCAVGTAVLDGAVNDANAILDAGAGDVFELTATSLGARDGLLFDAVDDASQPVLTITIRESSAFFSDVNGAEIGDALALSDPPWTLRFIPDEGVVAFDDQDLLEQPPPGLFVRFVRVRAGIALCDGAPCEATPPALRLRRLAPACVE